MFYSGTKQFVFRAAAPKVPPLLHDSQMKMMMRVLVFGLLSDECFSLIWKELVKRWQVGLGVAASLRCPSEEAERTSRTKLCLGPQKTARTPVGCEFNPQRLAVKDTPRGTQVELHRQETNKEPAGVFCSLGQLITQLWDGGGVYGRAKPQKKKVGTNRFYFFNFKIEIFNDRICWFKITFPE